MLGGAVGSMRGSKDRYAEAYDQVLSQLSSDQRDEVWEVIKTVAKDVENVTKKERNKAIEILDRDTKK